MKTLRLILLCAIAAPALFGQNAQIPQKLNYQGRVTVQGVNFNCTGQFKFALVDGGYNLNQTATAVGAYSDGNSITNISILNAGYGYPTAPVVTISAPDMPGGGGGGGGGGFTPVQASAVAYLNGEVPPGGGGGGGGRNPGNPALGGIVTSIVITNPGAGYSNNGSAIHTATFSSPPANLVTTTLWSNDGTSTAGGPPTAAVTLPVNNGLYSVALGDTALANMTTVPANIFQEDAPLPPISGIVPGPKDLRLRVWFNDGTHDFQQLTPDQPLHSAAFAYLAGNVPNGAITSAKIASGAVTGGHLADGAVGPTKLANNSVSSAKLADASISPGKLLTPAPPATGQMLHYDGTQFTWAVDGLSLPYSSGASSTSSAFTVTNNSIGPAITGNGTTGDGVTGYTGAAGRSAIFGQNNNFAGGGQGVYGYGFFGATGVLGVSNSGDGVSGRTNGTFKSGVFGYATGMDSTGVHGSSELHHGVYARTFSTNKAAIYADAPNGAEAVHGHSSAGDGVVGFTGNLNKSGVFGFSDNGNGVSGSSSGVGKSGIYGSTDELEGYGGYFYNSQSNGSAIKAVGNVDVDGVLRADRLSSNTATNLKNLLGSGGFSWFASSATVMEIPSGAGNISFSREVKFNKDIEVSEYATPYAYSPFWSVFSDASLKNIGDKYSRSLSEVSQIRTLNYRYKKGNAANMPDDLNQIGVVAQELQKIFPEAVSPGKGGLLTVNPTPVFWAMVNSIKELKAENDALKKQLADENASLRARLEALEKQSKPDAHTP